MDLIKHPKGYCPKCGMGDAFTGSPYYRKADGKYGTEYMIWYCTYCSFPVRTKTLGLGDKSIEESTE